MSDSITLNAVRKSHRNNIVAARKQLVKALGSLRWTNRCFDHKDAAYDLCVVVVHLLERELATLEEQPRPEDAGLVVTCLRAACSRLGYELCEGSEPVDQLYRVEVTLPRGVLTQFIRIPNGVLPEQYTEARVRAEESTARIQILGVVTEEEMLEIRKSFTPRKIVWPRSEDAQRLADLAERTGLRAAVDELFDRTEHFRKYRPKETTDFLLDIPKVLHKVKQWDGLRFAFRKTLPCKPGEVVQVYQGNGVVLFVVNDHIRAIASSEILDDLRKLEVSLVRIKAPGMAFTSFVVTASRPNE